MSRSSRFVRLRHADGAPLPLRVRRCDTFLCRLRGLTFRRALAPDEGLLFEEATESRLGTSIHMFFVFFPIGVVWLAADGTSSMPSAPKPSAPTTRPKRPRSTSLEARPTCSSWVEIGERLTIEPVASTP